MSTAAAMSLVYLTFIASAIALYLIHRKLDGYRRYRFHNQSESGATTFDTYEQAKSYERKVTFFTGLRNLVSFPFVFSLFIIVMYWLMSK